MYFVVSVVSFFASWSLVTSNTASGWCTFNVYDGVSGCSGNLYEVFAYSTNKCLIRSNYAGEKSGSLIITSDGINMHTQYYSDNYCQTIALGSIHSIPLGCSYQPIYGVYEKLTCTSNETDNPIPTDNVYVVQTSYDDSISNCNGAVSRKFAALNNYCIAYGTTSIKYSNLNIYHYPNSDCSGTGSQTVLSNSCSDYNFAYYYPSYAYNPFSMQIWSMQYAVTPSPTSIATTPPSAVPSDKPTSVAPTSRAPTGHPTAVTVMPTSIPTQDATTITPGKWYMMTLHSEAGCQGTMYAIFAYPLNKCLTQFSTTDGSLVGSREYTCTDGFVSIKDYSDPNCSNLYYNSQHSSGYEANELGCDYYGAMVKRQCVMIDTSEPIVDLVLPLNANYNIQSGFDSKIECSSNTVRQFGFLDGYCFSYSSGASYKYTFPYQYWYNSNDCDPATMSASYPLNTECEDTSVFYGSIHNGVDSFQMTVWKQNVAPTCEPTQLPREPEAKVSDTIFGIVKHPVFLCIAGPLIVAGITLIVKYFGINIFGCDKNETTKR